MSGSTKALLFVVFMVVVPLLPVTYVLMRRLPSRERDVVSGRASGTPFAVISIVGACVVGAAFVALAVVLGAQALASEEGREVDPRKSATSSAFDDPGDADEVQGDVAAGKRVFLRSGCGDCHELEDAGKNGAVGPSLDEDRPEFDVVVDCVTTGPGEMPAFTGKLGPAEIRDVAKYVSTAAGAGRQ